MKYFIANSILELVWSNFYTKLISAPPLKIDISNKVGQVFFTTERLVLA